MNHTPINRPQHVLAVTDKLSVTVILLRSPQMKMLCFDKLQHTGRNVPAIILCYMYRVGHKFPYIGECTVYIFWYLDYQFPEAWIGRRGLPDPPISHPLISIFGGT